MLNYRWQAVLLGLVVMLSALVFLPGRSGPLIFDDYSNLIENSYVKVTTLDWETLRRAAYSLDAGPLQRPISMITFALNYYWAGTFLNTTHYKMTNIAIHAICGLLVFWLTYLILGRLDRRSSVLPSSSRSALLVLAATTAILWVVHPIQVSTVLYVVQRMTQLSALFVLAALITYIYARNLTLTGKRTPSLVLAGVVVVFGAFAMLSKENAILLPLFIALIEFSLYSTVYPWTLWRRLSPYQRHFVIIGVACLLIAVAVGAIYKALPSYDIRQFTMYERILTQGRVVFFYLSLIFAPRLDQFGHQHDDISISTSLLTPWTTAPALLFHALALVAAFWVRRRQPLIAFGILWFYISHLLESTIFALEIAYEHRNYLALLGPVLVLAGVVQIAIQNTRWRHAKWALSAVAILFGVVTTLRAEQWKDPNMFYRYEAMHHPRSPRIQIGLSVLLEAQGRFADATEAARRAAELDPKEAGYLIHLHLLKARMNQLPTPEEQERTLELLKTYPISASTFLGFQHTVNCLQTWCKLLQMPLEKWAQAIISRTPGEKSYYYYLLGMSYATQGRIKEATYYLQRSYEDDRVYLHPLFAQASIFVQLEDLENAENVLRELRLANARTQHPRDEDLAQLERDIAALRIKFGKSSPHPKNR